MSFSSTIIWDTQDFLSCTQAGGTGRKFQPRDLQVRMFVELPNYPSEQLGWLEYGGVAGKWFGVLFCFSFVEVHCNQAVVEPSEIFSDAF